MVDTGEYLFGTKFSVLKGSRSLGKLSPNCKENSEALRNALGFFWVYTVPKVPETLVVRFSAPPKIFLAVNSADGEKPRFKI